MAQVTRDDVVSVVRRFYSTDPAEQSAALREFSEQIKADPNALVYLREVAPPLYDFLITTGLKVQAEVAAVRAATAGEA